MVSRRGFLQGGAIGVAGSAIGATSGSLVANALNNTAAETATAKRQLPFYGKHQMGIETPIQAVTNLVAFDLKPETDRSSMLRWMTLLTDDIARLSRGEPVLADPAPELAIGPAGFSAYVGLGKSMFIKLGMESDIPAGFIDLPAFKMDQLEEKFSGGDVVIHVAADDPIALSHATRSLVRDSIPFASVRWTQSGFAHTPGVVKSGVTHRNLMGQIDGTANPQLNSDDFASVVWMDQGPEWAVGGTQMVFRRIAMQLDTWDQLGTKSKEEVIGRKLASGAPLTGTLETDAPDFAARLPNGLSVIPDFAHIRRAAPEAFKERIFRRPFSYEAGISESGSVDVGLLWCSYQANIEEQFLPIQRRLEEFDLLNKWTVPVGSATFFIPKGPEPDSVIAQALFS
ncbi:MAG: Dyp-type peroxidase [Aquiluna sp.]|nr:Dyp-type peroxidase [Aquiluna sp.]MCF8546193.1 Dyp-type peroxidase [Aquiluna sp.]